MTQKTKHSQWVGLRKKIQKYYDVTYILKPTKVKIRTNKIIVIAVTWEFGTLGDAPIRMAAMCPFIIYFG